MPAHTHTADETFTPYYELLPRYWFQCSIPHFLPAFTPTRLYVMCFKKKIDSFPAGLRNLPCLIWHISLTHILFPSLHLPRSLLLAMHKQSSSHSGSPVFAFPPTLFYPILLPSSLFLPTKQLMSLPVWETYGKRLVTAWRMWRRVKEDGVLTPMCETQSITDFFLTLSGVKQVLSKQFTRPHRHLWGVIITQCCSCLITLRGFCNADEGLFYFLH